MVRDAGFLIARTVDRYRTAPGPALETGTTVHAYRHLVDGPQVRRVAGGDLALAARLFRHWDDLAVHLFDRVLATGGVFHLWGHSWEVAARRDWDRLERVLAHISRRPGVRYVTNGELPVAGETCGRPVASPVEAAP